MPALACASTRQAVNAVPSCRLAACFTHAFVAGVLLQRVPWSEKFPDADPQALDLMDKMLQFHPGKRIDVATALKHPWLAQLHDETQEPSAPGATTVWQCLISTCVSLTCVAPGAILCKRGVPRMAYRLCGHVQDNRLHVSG